jgi:hypothetical protein
VETVQGGNYMRKYGVLFQPLSRQLCYVFLSGYAILCCDLFKEEKFWGSNFFYLAFLLEPIFIRETHNLTLFSVNSLN